MALYNCGHSKVTPLALCNSCNKRSQTIRRCCTNESVQPVRVFETATWRELVRLEQTGNISVGFSPDGKWLVTSSGNTVRLFETGTWHEKRLFDCKGSVTGVSFSPDGRRLTTQTVTSTWRGRRSRHQRCVWDIKTGDEIAVLSDESKNAGGESGTESPTGQLQKTGRQTVRASEMSTWQDVVWARQTTTAKNPDGSWQATVVGNQVRLWPLRSQGLIAEACTRLTRNNLTKEEWAKYVGDEQAPRDICQPLPARSWNDLCWTGSLRGYAAEVMEACEQAVVFHAQSPDYRDSRGVARALSGNSNGAIEDFQVYIARTNDAEGKAQRQGWIDAPRTGKNPFTPEEIEKLLTK